MKHLVTLATAILVYFVATSSARSFTLNSVSNCGPTYSNGVSFNLDAGAHNIEWISGAYSLWSSNGFNGGLTWIGWTRAYVHATGEIITFGAPASPTWYATKALAEAAAVGIHTINLSVASQVTFYLSDGGGCGDNRGSVTLEFATVPVENHTWGSIKALYEQ